MKIIRYILLFLLLVGQAYGASYTAYFKNDGSGNIVGDWDDSECTEVSPCNTIAEMTAVTDGFFNTYGSSGNTLTIYLDNADTFTMTSSVGIKVNTSNVTIDASSWGSGTKAIIDGNATYPADENQMVIAVGDSTSNETVNNVTIKGLRIQNLHDGSSMVERGGGIIFNGSQHFGNTGLVEHCEFAGIGSIPINIYQVANSGGSSTAIKLEHNLIEDARICEGIGVSSCTGLPQAINANDGVTHGHEARYNVIRSSYGEGIGAYGFDIIEYNVISGTESGNIYYEPRGASPSGTQVIRNNLIFYDSITGHSWSGSVAFRVDDEVPASGTNTSTDLVFYGNAIFGPFAYGIDLRNRSGNSHWGSIKVYGNEIIDSLTLFAVQYSVEFNSVEIKNNTFIAYDKDKGSLFKGYNNTDWSNWTFHDSDGGNHFWYSGEKHTGSNNASVLTDSTKTWTTNYYVGVELYNLTDGSSCTVTSNTSNTMTCSGGLSGGTESDWDTNDLYAMICDNNVNCPTIFSFTYDSYGDPKLGKTSGWRTQTTIPTMNELSPQLGSDLTDNSKTDSTISYNTYLISGEFSNVLTSETLMTGSQSSYGSDWDFGFKIYQPSVSGVKFFNCDLGNETTSEAEFAEILGYVDLWLTAPKMYDDFLSAGEVCYGYGYSSIWECAKATNPNMIILNYKHGTQTMGVDDSNSICFRSTADRLSTIDASYSYLIARDLEDAYNKNEMDFGYGADAGETNTTWYSILQTAITNDNEGQNCQVGADGYYLDEFMLTNLGPRWGYKYTDNTATNGDVTYSTNSWPWHMIWHAGKMSSFVHGLGDKVAINITECRSDDHYNAFLAMENNTQSWDDKPDYALIEFGPTGIGTTGNFQYWQELQWKNGIDALKNSSNISVLYQNYLQTTIGSDMIDQNGTHYDYYQILWFGMGSFMLGDSGNDYFGTDTGTDGSYNQSNYFPEWDEFKTGGNLDFGVPTGTYAITTSNGINIYWRQFSRGRVYVNPSHTTNSGSISLPSNTYKERSHSNYDTAWTGLGYASTITVNKMSAVFLEGGYFISGANPADDSSNIATSASLSWSNPDNYTSVDVYIEEKSGSCDLQSGDRIKDDQDISSVSNADLLIFLSESGALPVSTTYCWRVDVNYSGGTQTGDVYEFTTTGGPPVNTSSFSNIIP